MNEKWYAVMTDRRDNDWSYGTPDLDVAEKMTINFLDDYPEAYIAVIDGDECVAEIKPADFNISKRYAVKYGASESRELTFDGKLEAVDFMLVNVEDIELYAEMVNPTWDEKTEQYGDEYATFDELKNEIIRKAIAKHIEPEWLDFGD